MAISEKATACERGRENEQDSDRIALAKPVLDLLKKRSWRRRRTPSSSSGMSEESQFASPQPKPPLSPSCSSASSAIAPSHTVVVHGFAKDAPIHETWTNSWKKMESSENSVASTSVLYDQEDRFSYSPSNLCAALRQAANAVGVPEDSSECDVNSKLQCKLSMHRKAFIARAGAKEACNVQSSGTLNGTEPSAETRKWDVFLSRLLPCRGLDSEEDGVLKHESNTHKMPEGRRDSAPPSMPQPFRALASRASRISFPANSRCSSRDGRDLASEVSMATTKALDCQFDEIIGTLDIGCQTITGDPTMLSSKDCGTQTAVAASLDQSCQHEGTVMRGLDSCVQTDTIKSLHQGCQHNATIIGKLDCGTQSVPAVMVDQACQHCAASPETVRKSSGCQTIPTARPLYNRQSAAKAVAQDASCQTVTEVAPILELRNLCQCKAEILEAVRQKRAAAVVLDQACQHCATSPETVRKSSGCQTIPRARPLYNRQPATKAVAHDANCQTATDTAPIMELRNLRQCKTEILEAVRQKRAAAAAAYAAAVKAGLIPPPGKPSRDGRSRRQCCSSSGARSEKACNCTCTSCCHRKVGRPLWNPDTHISPC
jgi:hypothetical protein